MQQPPEQQSATDKVVRALAIQARILQFQTNILVDLQDPKLPVPVRFKQIRQHQGKIGTLCRELEKLSRQP